MQRTRTVSALSLALCLAYGGTAAADALCDHWNTEIFFRIADAEGVTRCVTAGVDLGARDEYAWTPLHLAARFSTDPAVITALVASGADLEAQDEFRRTPLHYAATLSKPPSVIAALTDAGANLEARDEFGWTPLHLAAKDGKTLQ